MKQFPELAVPQVKEANLVPLHAYCEQRFPPMPWIMVMMIVIAKSSLLGFRQSHIVRCDVQTDRLYTVCVRSKLVTILIYLTQHNS